MSKDKFTSFIVVLFLLSTAPAQTAPVSGIYQIVSGTYIQCCGFSGNGISQPLPNESQSFVDLSVDGNLANMTFLGADMQSVYRIVVCPGTEPIYFNFNYGFVSSNSIFFHVDPGPQSSWSYSVSNSANALRIDGTLGATGGFCADVPTRFSHSNMVAVLMPSASIRVSEVEVCWNTISNVFYQVQFRSDWTTNLWKDLGSPLPGNGSTNCIPDKVPPGEPRRFYRVVPVP
jgi:hypothetical protein